MDVSGQLHPDHFIPRQMVPVSIGWKGG